MNTTRRSSLSAAKVPFFTKLNVSKELVKFLEMPSNTATFFEVYQFLCVYLDKHKLRSETEIKLNMALQDMFYTKEKVVNSVRMYELLGYHLSEL